MKPADRQLLFDELMKGSLEVCRGNPRELVHFEQSTTADLDLLEPRIDKIIEKEKEELLASFSREGWKDSDAGLAFEVIPEGASCIVLAKFAGKNYLFQVDRSRLRDFGNYLMLEAAK